MKKIVLLVTVVLIAVSSFSQSKKTPQQTLFTGNNNSGDATAISFSVYRGEDGKTSLKMIYEQELYNISNDDVLCFKPGISSIYIDLNGESYWRLDYWGRTTCSDVEQYMDSKNYDHTLTVYFDLFEKDIKKLKASETTEIVIAFSQRHKIIISIDTYLLNLEGTYHTKGSQNINPQKYFIEAMKDF